MIELLDLTKRYGPKTAVDHLTVNIQPGRVTGFLGPNGAGKSTTMRLIVGLDRPTGGQATINGQAFTASKSPLTQVGTLLDAKACHPSRSGRSHLMGLALTHGLSRRRVDNLIEFVGLGDVAHRRVGGYSLGMCQRLGIAAALLGDPAVLLLDEPVNGLDPEGVRWVRDLVRSQAAEGRTVFLSSHLMSEMAQTADHLVIIGRGKLIADSPIAEVLAAASGAATRVRTPQAEQLIAGLAGPGITITAQSDGALLVSGLAAADVGERAAQSGWVLHELSPVVSSLEEAYMELTDSAVEYRTGSANNQKGAANE
ncbi:MAG: ABC transporter ATP-binding protein [Bifidobacteriaceae bacterium]|jgi:ABC-2 type transport system ATP-binding protein|nr:ABC transporter ATP-binding protein [Bifidobacteriaceae bacterium]